MGIPIGKNVYPLPLLGDSALAINQGSAPILIGTMRDNLAQLGMTLQPLASITLDGATQYYAVCPTADGQSLDFLPGGNGFAPSPQQVVSVLNTAALATAIGAANNAAGTRLVIESNPDQITDSLVTPPNQSIVMPASNGVAFGLQFQNTGGVYGTGTALVKAEWFDSTVNLITKYVRYYELNPTLTYIEGPCPGGAVQLTYVSQQGANPFGLDYSFTTNSNPTAVTERIIESGDLDNVLLDNVGGTLASGAATASPTLAPLTAGRIYAAFNGAGANAQFRFTYGWGWGVKGGSRLLLPVSAAVAGSATVLEFPATGRPLAINVNNVGSASGNWSLSAWTSERP